MQKKEKEVKEKEKSKEKIDYILLTMIVILLALGLIMVLSAGAPSSLAKTDDSYSYFKNQSLYAIMGLGVMFFLTYKFDTKIFKNHYWFIYGFSVLILLLVLVPGLGVSANGATRWLKIAGIQFQPSEITKFGMIIFLAGYLADNKEKIKDPIIGFIKPLAFVALPVVIAFFIQNHLSVGLVMVAIAAIMLLVAGSKFTYFMCAFVLVLGAAGVYWGYSVATLEEGETNFRIDRILNFMDPWQDPTGDGWQVIQSLYAIGSGGLFGSGLGESKQKYLYIPEPQNDFIFSIYAEEFGFIGCVIIILLFTVLISRGLLISLKTSDLFNSLLAVGITSLIMVQAFMNIGVVTSSIPNTGMPLPFFSAGGSSLLILLSMCGVLLGISRKVNKV